MGLEVGAQRLQRGRRILPGRDAHGQAGRAGRGQDIARQLQRGDVHADDGQGRPGPQARGEVAGADQVDAVQDSRVGAEVGLGVLGEVRRGLRTGDQPGYGDVAVLVVQRGHQTAHGGHRVQDGTAVLAGVQGVVQDVQAHVRLDEAAQGRGQGRDADPPVG